MNLTQRNVVLLVAAVGLAVPTFLQMQSEVDTFVDYSEIPLMFDGFTSDNAGLIVLAQPKEEQPPQPENAQPGQKLIAYDQLALQRTDKGWGIGVLPGQAPTDLAGAPVATDRVESTVFKHLRAIRADRNALVQAEATPEQLAEYGLDEEHAFVIRVLDKTMKNVVAEVLVGKDAGEGQRGTEAVRGTFVRKRGSNDVVLHEWEQPWLRKLDTDIWIDRTLARLEPEKIRQLSIKNAATDGRAFVFGKEPGKSAWQAVDVPEGLGAVRQSEIEGIVQRCRFLSAQSFVKPLARAGDMAALGLFPPQIEVRITVDEDGSERVIELQIGNKLDDKPEYYVTCSESQFLMTWPSGLVVPFELDVQQRLFDPAPQSGDAPPKDGDDKVEKKVDDEKKGEEKKGGDEKAEQPGKPKEGGEKKGG